MADLCEGGNEPPGSLKPRVATQGSVRRIDIIVIKNNSAYILDPTIRFETHADQPHEVDSEKKRIYEPTIPFYKDKYSLSHIDMIGLMVGARGTIPSFFANKCKNLGLTHSTVKEIAISALKGSVHILRDHLYGSDNGNFNRSAFYTDHSKPSSFTSFSKRGLTPTWEAYLQQININTKLENLNDQHVNAVRDYETIRTRCLSELQVSRDEATGSVKQLRQHLRHRGFKTWCAYPQKGKGVVLFEEVPAANSWIIKHEGLSSSEWREILKMIAMVAPHVLGSCPQGEVLRIKRHIIRSMIADALRSKNLDDHEEVHCIADGGSNRRIDIIAIKRNKKTAEIIYPTIIFEISATQPSEVNEEKKKIYEHTIQYLSAKYNIKKITVTGLFFGARGTIPKAFVKWREKYKLTRDLQDAIVTSIIKFSVAIFRQYLYGVHSI
ncbi:hypothetical protein ANN_08258 [Periplaneta americana]|uniref:Restriction endonuclease n=1 Tax=Periplaneta americana TaxID=6978 RepID=A0ABQ8T228_PERAM|nr:hypothetical protein ANN_08258 [Periplaneta americana]